MIFFTILIFGPASRIDEWIFSHNDDVGDFFRKIYGNLFDPDGRIEQVF